MKGHIQRRGSRFRAFYYFGGKKLSRSFGDKDNADIWLAGMIVKESEGTLDPRDYSKDNPLGFENKVQEFLRSKRLLKGIKKYEQRLRFGINEWGNKNIKSIGYQDIDNLLTRLQEERRSSKYVKDIRDTIRCLYRWLWNCGEITYDQMPRFPTVKYSMSYRNIVSKADQLRILAEVKRISAFNPRIYIGCLFLSTYINVRPGELISIREKDIELENRRIKIEGKNTKTGEQKYIYLLGSDVESLGKQPAAFGALHFFRHIVGRGGNSPNTKFGKGYIYGYWKRACANLGIEGVDLYGGTRHSSAIALRTKGHSPEAVKRATQHSTNEAFERYLRVTGDELRGLYADTRGEVRRIDERARKKRS